MCVFLRRYIRQVRIKVGIVARFRKLRRCEVGKTLTVKGVLEMFKAQNEIEEFGVGILHISRVD